MKKFSKLSIILTILISSFCIACQNDTSRKVQNIEAFARLYGYARWFHPSDEAQQIDWDKFAVLGVQKVENIQSNKELRDVLYQLFSPIVQGLQIFETNRPEKFNLDVLVSPDPNAKPVAWQHSGVWLSERSNIYRSIRTNRTEFDPDRDGAGVSKVIMSTTHLQGKEVRLSGYFKNKSQEKGNARLSIQYLLPNGDVATHPIYIESQDWGKYELTATIPESTDVVAFGLWIIGDSEIWADSFEFFVNNGGKWELADTVNMGFENGKIDENLATDWRVTDARHFTAEVTDRNAHSGRYSLRLIFDSTKRRSGLFDQMPAFGEVINERIDRNLTAILPLTLLTNNFATYPTTETSSLAWLKSEIDNIRLGRTFNMQANLASVVVAWNVLQHFFPYFDVIDTNWDRVLTQTLRSTLANETRQDFYVTLSQMVAQIQDGHGWVEPVAHMHDLPIRTEYIENQLVITASNDSALKRGDIIRRIDGKPAMRALEEKERMISGSPHLRRHRALNILGSRFDSGEVSLVIERDGRRENVTIQNSNAGSKFFNPVNEQRPHLHETIIEIEPGIFYVNMAKVTESDFRQKIDVLANAKAVIFDQRDVYSQLQFGIISHLTSKPVTSPLMLVPQTIFPNRKAVEFYTPTWSLPPQQPLFSSKAIIITNPGMVSAAETALSIIDHYNLAITVGETTAGCNGNINFIPTPSGYTVAWTGMKVLKHDGSQHFLIGYAPDYPVRRTIQAVREGRDEALEKALEIARRQR